MSAYEKIGDLPPGIRNEDIERHFSDPHEQEKREAEREREADIRYEMLKDEGRI